MVADEFRWFLVCFSNYAQIDILRPLFERYAQRLTSSSHMNNLIPAVLEKEKEKLKAELHNVEEASIIFDRTAQLGEALAIVLIWADRPMRLRNTRFGFLAFVICLLLKVCL